MEINTDKIDQKIARLRWTYSDLAREIGCTKQWVYWKLTYDQAGTTFKTVEKFARALDAAPKDLIK